MSQPDILHDKKERNDFFIALGIITLVGFFLWYNMFASEPHNVMIKEEAAIDHQSAEPTDIYESGAIIEDESEDQGYITPPVSSDHISEQVEVHPEALDEQVKEEVLDEINSNQLQATSQVSEVIEEAKEGAKEVMEDMKDSAVVTTITLNEVVEKSVEQVEDMKDDAADQIKEVVSTPVQVRSASDDDICHISVGLYKEQKNIDKILSRLQQAGFDAYTKSFPRSIQVGVYVSCNRSEAQSILSEIRSDFARDAYIEEYQ